ncbi:hypothetical protein [uncultured Methanoregula sp.]|uniref:hypothetical protein n=1 Tax=uncultured Methanoregula sp. TaxID=1005933 RepID=UPI002AAA798C|nr:hypothetical protein [uncultured Methanoregula sp.]
MTQKNLTLWIVTAVCLLMLAIPVLADTGDQNANVLYQTSYASDPHMITNSPSSDYWDAGNGRYHFSIEPSSGGYAYVPVEYKDTSFTLDYDLVLTRVDSGATFRLAFSSNEMNPEKGPVVMTEFTNAKFGQIMWLQVVTPGNKIIEVNSQSGQTSYAGATVKYELNKPYHVTVSYDKALGLVTVKVSDKQSGQELWSYFVKTTDQLNGMARLWIGAIGDYGPQNIYAQGYIDNLRITTPGTVTEAPTEAPVISNTAVPITTTKKVTPKTTVPTPYPTSTPQSPSSLLLPLVALGIIGSCVLLVRKKE